MQYDYALDYKILEQEEQKRLQEEYIEPEKVMDSEMTVTEFRRSDFHAYVEKLFKSRILPVISLAADLYCSIAFDYNRNALLYFRPKRQAAAAKI